MIEIELYEDFREWSYSFAEARIQNVYILRYKNGYLKWNLLLREIEKVLFKTPEPEKKYILNDLNNIKKNVINEFSKLPIINNDEINRVLTSKNIVINRLNELMDKIETPYEQPKAIIEKQYPILGMKKTNELLALLHHLGIIDVLVSKIRKTNGEPNYSAIGDVICFITNVNSRTAKEAIRCIYEDPNKPQNPLKNIENSRAAIDKLKELKINI